MLANKTKTNIKAISCPTYFHDDVLIIHIAYAMHVRVLCATTHSRVRQATAGVKCRQQSESKIFGHVQQLILVPEHSTTFLHHDSHGMASQQSTKRTVKFYTSKTATIYYINLKCHVTSVHFETLTEMSYSPQHPDVGLEHRHHNVIIQPYILHHSPHRRLKLHRLI